MAPYQNAESGLYDVLEIHSTATRAEIKKAYHKAALRHHPDKVPEAQKKDAEIKFKEISRAYEILHDEEKRHMYDIHGMGVFEQGGSSSRKNTEAADMEDFFSEFFAMGQDLPSEFFKQSSTQQPRKGRNEEQEYHVTLEDLYKGKTVKFAVSKNIICSHCKGSGGKYRAKPGKCDKCKGDGFVIGLRSIAPGLVSQERITCSNCSGLGKLFKEKDRCKKCKGVKTIPEKKVLEVHIPKGSQAGERIVLAGEADQAPNQKPGDIIFTLCQDEHEFFSRFGDNLSAVIHITLIEALTGFKRVVLKHLDGRGIRIKNPPGKIIRPGQNIKIRGEGMPRKKSHARGDLYLTVKVDFPDDRWAKNRVSLAELKRLIPQNPPIIEAKDISNVDFELNFDPREFKVHHEDGDHTEEDYNDSYDNEEDEDDDDEDEEQEREQEQETLQCVQQ